MIWALDLDRGDGMRVWLLHGGILLITLLVADTAYAAGASDSGTAVWLADYAQARMLARRTGRPLFVVFRCQH